ncbi:Oidioi.mRNA.OKI2018_I69.PAR.g12869.t1.cds [Oikopleura dioica]|uniref:Oidioi.mRNA.OKI2018_I69.PAR.g12869.t1.cds n=1 Tax=Oikopleura dioica TaxID=34765 RepID=A0ABN7S593_OIKDI|nr:Oidioi.mRNA.OKI2018_I69.PAR.g12869.t1.cds [Oikopleura dioica]
MKLFGITLALASAQGVNNETDEQGRSYFPEPIPTDDYKPVTKTPFWPVRTLPPMDHCWKCEGENFGLCFMQHYKRYGYQPLMCPMGKVCSMTERRRGGKVEWVSMQCKDLEVCEEEQYHNVRPCPQMPSATECNQMKYGHSYEKVPSVCRKCFNPPKGAREAWDFIDRLNEADDKGENGLPVKEWMDGKDYAIPGPNPGPVY